MRGLFLRYFFSEWYGQKEHTVPKNEKVAAGNPGARADPKVQAQFFFFPMGMLPALTGIAFPWGREGEGRMELLGKPRAPLQGRPGERGRELRGSPGELS